MYIENNKMDSIDNKIVYTIIKKLKELPTNSETCIIKLLGNEKIMKYSDEELTKISCCIFDKAKEENIMLDFSKYENQKMGLIYNIPFIKK